MNKPAVYVLGGANGTGKTTAAGVLLPEHVRVDRFVNADAIARGISPNAAETNAFQAGRLMIAQIRLLREARATFAFETTLASRSLAHFLREAQETGFLVHLIYMWVPTVEISLRRVRARVARGGHGVPENVVRRRYRRGLVNFLELYKPLANSWLVCDNSGERPLVVADGGKGMMPRIVEPRVWAAIERGRDGQRN